MAKKKTRSEEESYRVPFFIISSILMGSMLWLLYQEFVTRRPWKNYQIGWFQVQESRAKKNLASEETWLQKGVLVTKGEDGEEEEIEIATRVAELEKTIAELEGDIVNSPKRAEFEQLKGQLAEAEVKVKDAETDLAFEKANEDEFYYYYRRDKHHDDEAGEKRHAEEVAVIQGKVAAKSDAYTQAVKARDAIIDKLDTIRKQVAAAKRELGLLRSGVVAAKRAVESTQGQMPEILQHWNQEIELVDRCHTCHAGSDKCGFSAPEEILGDAVQARLNADSLRKKYCITREEADKYVEAAEEVRDSWTEDEKLGFEDVKGKLGLETEPVLALAKELGLSEADAEALYRSHPNRTELFKFHPGGHFGCTTCHYGQGRQTKGIGLNLVKLDNAPFTHARRDHYWLSQILDTKKHHVEASCFNCHKGDYELEMAPHLTEARKLVQHLGCTGCHPLGVLDPERKHGPTLTKIGAKMDTGWLVKWLEYPKKLRPRTRMPNFWPEVERETPPGERKLVCYEFDYARGAAKSPAVVQDCADKRDREVAYITAYLLDKSKDESFAAMPSWADAKKGEQIFTDVGCMACHNVDSWDGASHLPGTEDRDLAPNLTGIGDKVKSPGWFYAWVKNPKEWWHETRMPQLRLTDEEAWHVAAWLAGHKTGQDYSVTPKIKAYMEEDGAIEKGKGAIAWYGCNGCHEIEGFETRGRVGVELTDFGSKPVSKLDFGDVPEFTKDHHSQTWEGWLRRKLHDPRGYRYERVETRMPQFDLTEKEAEAVILFLKGQNLETEGWPDHIRYQPTDARKAVQRGAYLVEAYNCVGCHQVDGKGIDVDGDHVVDGGSIYRWFAAHEDEKFRAPPRLMKQGAKVYPDWLYKFLKEPFKLRENYKVRMPTFQLDDQTTADFVAYFAAKAGTGYPYVEKKSDVLSAADRKMAEEMFAAAQCLNCHNLNGVSNDPRNIAPNLLLTADRLQYDWLFHWLKNPAEQIPGVAMPGFFYFDEDAGDYQSPLPAIAGGDWRRQVELLRAYVIMLGREAGEVARAPAP